MKKIKLLVLLFFAFNGVAYSLTQEELVRYLRSQDTPESIEKVSQLGLAHTDLLEKILLSPSGDSVARYNAFFLLSNASRIGLYDRASFFDLASRQLQNLHTYSSPYYEKDERQAFSSSLGNYSYSPVLKKGVPISENFENLFLLLKAMKANALLSKKRTKQYFYLLVESQKQIEENNFETAIKLVEKAKFEIQIRHQGEFEELGTKILNTYMENLILQINDCKNVLEK